MNGIIQYILFSNWLLALNAVVWFRDTYVIVCISSLLLFTDELCEYSTAIKIFCLPIWLILVWAFMHKGITNMFFMFLSK